MQTGAANDILLLFEGKIDRLRQSFKFGERKGQKARHSE